MVCSRIRSVCNRKAIDHMRPYILGRRFQLITDQKGVSFLFDSRPKNRIKNAKINRWRIELSEYNFEVIYRPGSLNIAADTFSRISSVNRENPEILIKLIHQEMGHPGMNRLKMYVEKHFNIYGIENLVKDCVQNCSIWAKEKPRFFKIPTKSLIQSTKPWQRISIDFVGPKPSVNNKYLFTVIDEFSRYPFAFSVSRITTKVAINCLKQLFTLFGPPSYVHSDRDSAFESQEFINFLQSWNIYKSRTSPYHPAGNGQIERFNGIIWKTIIMRLRQSKKSIENWED